MAKPRKSTFIWQPALIVLPVIILTVVGFVFLRQDKALVRQEAAERAQGLTEEIVTSIWAQLLPHAPGSQAPYSFQVNAAGELVFPPPAPANPIPKPFDIATLNEEQLRLWLDANRADASGNRRAGIDAYHRILDSNPPPEFAGAAWYSLGLILTVEGEYLAATEAFSTLLDKYPNARGESGIPLAPLAQAKSIEIFLEPDLSAQNPVFETQPTPATAFVPFESFYSNIVNNPTALTPFLLNRDWKPVRSTRSGDTQHVVDARSPKREPLLGESEPVRQKWLAVWRQREFSRGLYVAATRSRSDHLNRSGQVGGKADRPFTSRFSWLAIDGETWLCTRLNEVDATNTWFVCRTQQEVGSLIAATIPGHMPNYFGITVELGGVALAQSANGEFALAHRTAAGALSIASTVLPPSTILASASHLENGGEPLKVNLYLADAAALFNHQKVRSRWLGLVIAASAAGALIGLFSARRAFAQQQALADLKTNFVSSVSHEMRAPIASVRLMAESLERGKIHDSAKQSEYFRFIGQECRRLSGLIENVLDFSRIEQGRKLYQFEPTDVLGLTRETVALMQTYAEEKRVKLEFMPPVEENHNGAPTSDFQISVDGRAIQQALVNLIDNALKHSPEGEIVRVGLESIAAPRGIHNQTSESTEANGKPSGTDVHNARNKVILWVEDRGPGIPATEHERIFERFYRLGSELRRETQGVGIGLSIVKHVVEAHKGEVKVESEVGKGSRFVIELPN
jgi:signal transduction histidine kinase